MDEPLGEITFYLKGVLFLLSRILVDVMSEIYVPSCLTRRQHERKPFDGDSSYL